MPVESTRLEILTQYLKRAKEIRDKVRRHGENTDDYRQSCETVNRLERDVERLRKGQPRAT